LVAVSTKVGKRNPNAYCCVCINKVAPTPPYLYRYLTPRPSSDCATCSPFRQTRLVTYQHGQDNKQRMIDEGEQSHTLPSTANIIIIIIIIIINLVVMFIFYLIYLYNDDQLINTQNLQSQPNSLLPPREERDGFAARSPSFLAGRTYVDPFTYSPGSGPGRGPCPPTAAPWRAPTAPPAPGRTAAPPAAAARLPRAQPPPAFRTWA
jgi:hypothetical protein